MFQYQADKYRIPVESQAGRLLAKQTVQTTGISLPAAGFAGYPTAYFTQYAFHPAGRLVFRPFITPMAQQVTGQ